MITTCLRHRLTSPLCAVLLLCAMLLPSAISQAQSDELQNASDLELTFNVQDESTKQDLDKVSVVVSQNGAKQKTYSSGNHHQVELSLPMGKHVFDVLIERDEYVGKRLRFDLTNAPANSGGYSAIVSVSLFRKVKAFDESVMNAPLGTMRYSPFTNNMEWDMTEGLQRRTEVSNAKSKCQMATLANKKTKAKIDRHVLLGKESLEDRKFWVAIEECEKALQLLPFYPDAIAIYGAAKDSVDKRVQEGQLLMYELNIASGDLFMSEGNYEKALEAYILAKAFNTKATYPTERIADLSALIAKAEQEKAYMSTIDAANKAFEKARYEQAAAKYREALRIRPEDPHAMEQLRKAEAADKK